MSDIERTTLIDTAVEMYYRGAFEAIDLLMESVSSMPDQSQQIPLQDILVVLASARSAIEVKSKDRGDPQKLISDVLGK